MALGDAAFAPAICDGSPVSSLLLKRHQRHSFVRQVIGGVELKSWCSHSAGLAHAAMRTSMRMTALHHRPSAVPRSSVPALRRCI